MDSQDRIELFSPGPLGTCWSGRYHYLEPWAGCGHACPYCYARTRAPVRGSLEELGTAFERPVPLLDRGRLLDRIREEASSGRIGIVKLCRYTDLFTPGFVADGLALEILQVLADSPVQRLILTTKGVPDEALRRLMIERKEKFSYNAAVRPSALVPDSPLRVFDAGLAPLEARLDAAAELSAAGVQTTLHLDPFVAGHDDADEALGPFLAGLKRRGLDRVMFSYLLLSGPILETLEAALPPDALEDLLAAYNLSGSHRVLPREEETAVHALRDDLLRASVERTADRLQEEGFQFVLCSLKSVRGLDTRRYQRSMICDGSFYA